MPLEIRRGSMRRRGDDRSVDDDIVMTHNPAHHDTVTISKDHDTKKSTRCWAFRNSSWRTFSLRENLYMHTLGTRRMAFLLVVVNAIVFIMTRMATSPIFLDPLCSTPLPESYSPPTHPTYSSRSQRFPSHSERVQYYMGRWYEPQRQGYPLVGPFANNQHLSNRSASETHNLYYEPVVNPLDMNIAKLRRCVEFFPTKCGNLAGVLTSKQQAIATLTTAMTQNEFQQPALSWKRGATIWRYEGVLGLLQMIWQSFSTSLTADGDDIWLWYFGRGVPRATTTWHTTTPVWGQVRDIVADQDPEYHRNQRYPPQPHCPVCGPLHSTILVPSVSAQTRSAVAAVPRHDRPWNEKEKKLVWRGGNSSSQWHTSNQMDPPSGYTQRLQAVRNHLDSSLVDVKFTRRSSFSDSAITDAMVDEFRPLSWMLQHAYLLAVEGHDVPTGLLWMLFSNSVVFMPKPTYSSWAMQDKLEPYVHYIPVHRDMTNLEDRVAWANEHPEHADRIARQSTLFVYDLLFHPDASRDAAIVVGTMVYRYREFILRTRRPWRWESFLDISWVAWLEGNWERVSFVLVFVFFMWRR